MIFVVSIEEKSTARQRSARLEEVIRSVKKGPHERMLSLRSVFLNKDSNLGEFLQLNKHVPSFIAEYLEVVAVSIQVAVFSS